ncbi:MAG: hypothetical protein NTV23_00030 [Propionibacteriales bacterium]|nr:hypothetical protein [Propionibacteriales bacterium]
MARTRTSEPLNSSRRRQRSVRVTVAVFLLAVATVAVLGAIPTQSPVLLSISSVLAIALGWAALRIVWTEVLQSRREHATDRAATATAYRSLFSERAAEHAQFTTVMTERLAASNTSVHELQAVLVNAQRVAAEEAVRAETAESAFAAALVRVAELERSIDLLRDEQEAELALLVDTERGSVDDLLDFDEKVAQASGKHAKGDAKLA